MNETEQRAEQLYLDWLAEARAELGTRGPAEVPWESLTDAQRKRWTDRARASE